MMSQLVHTIENSWHRITIPRTTNGKVRGIRFRKSCLPYLVSISLLASASLVMLLLLSTGYSYSTQLSLPVDLPERTEQTSLNSYQRTLKQLQSFQKKHLPAGSSLMLMTTPPAKKTTNGELAE